MLKNDPQPTAINRRNKIQKTMYSIYIIFLLKH